MGGRKRPAGVPAPSDVGAANRMRATRRRDTAAELAVRSVLDAFGMTYDIDRSPLAGIRRRADMIFQSEPVAVFIDGCFWHGCPEHGTWPKRNADWWREKIEVNRRRDADTDHRLAEAGWRSVRVWEHDEPRAAAEQIRRAVDSAGASGT